MIDDTIVLVLSDNGASQEGGPLGFVNAMGPFNMIAEPMADKLARIDDIGGPDTHSNFPHGWAMAANTPLKRYKQNTHGGGIRDPLVVRLPARLRGGRSGRSAPSVLPRVRPRPDAARVARDRSRADDGGCQLRFDDRRRRGGHGQDHAVLRDVRPSRDLARRVQGGGVPRADDVVRRRRLGAVRPRRRLQREPRPRGRPARTARRTPTAAGGPRPRPTRCSRSTTVSASASPRTPPDSTAPAPTTRSGPGWATSRATWHRTSAAGATPSPPTWRSPPEAPTAC